MRRLPCFESLALRSYSALDGFPMKRRFHQTPFLLTLTSSISEVPIIARHTFRPFSLLARTAEPLKRGKQKISVGTTRLLELHTILLPFVAATVASRRRSERVLPEEHQDMRNRRPNHALQLTLPQCHG